MYHICICIQNIRKVSNCYTRLFESFVPKSHCSAMSYVAIRYFSNVFCNKFDTFRIFWIQIWYVFSILVTSMILFKCLRRYTILFYRFQSESNNLRIFWVQTLCFLNALGLYTKISKKICDLGWKHFKLIEFVSKIFLKYRIGT